jgi:4-amino-4-deoxy-L-arabinose transferase-like glycosyltransferase
MTKSRHIFIIIGLGLFFFLPFLGLVHLFDWDEINFAEAAREMIVTGNYSRVQIDYEVFTEKPPLFFWFQALSMHIFGINEFSSRLPNAICGIITLITLFLIGNKLKDKNFGFIWVLSYIGSFLPHLYFKSGIIDPFFNLFMFLAVYFIAQTTDSHERKKSDNLLFPALAGAFVGLAILTKGPVGLLIPLLTFGIFWLTVRKSIVKISELLVCTGSALFVTFLWIGPETYKYGFTFIKEFTERQIAIFSTSDAGHGEPVYYHPIVLFLGCFPIAQFAFRTFLFKEKTDDSLFIFRKWMLILFWVVLILFSIVKTKIVHYSSMCYFPISFLASYHLYYLKIGKIKINKSTVILLIITGLLMSLALTLLPIVGMNARAITPYIDDPFAVGNLQAKVFWGGWEWLIGLVYAIMIVVAIFLFHKNSIQQGIYTIFLSTAFCMLIYTAVVVPKIEQYSQGAAIRFYESLQGKPVYVITMGFKSYAHLFYFHKPPVTNPESRKEEWLANGVIDKDAYFVIKVTDREEFQKRYPQLQEIREENGFVFLKRLKN